jgi:hypothetical protein
VTMRIDYNASNDVKQDEDVLIMGEFN